MSENIDGPDEAARRTPWQQGWNAGYDYARDGTMREEPNPYAGEGEGTDAAKAAEWEAGYSQGLDDSYATTWLGGSMGEGEET